MFEDEKIAETKTCKFCNISFEITDKDLEFYEKVSPVFDGKKYLIPGPTLCPECRQQRRLSFRNERNIYKRKCDFSGKDIISIYSPDKKYRIYDQDIWWSDKWEALDYGEDFDFNKSFFEQFEKLMKNVPKLNLSRSNSENCEYTNIMINAKNCYLSFASSYSENVAYSTWTTNSKTSIDCFYCDKVEELYECIDCSKSYKLFYCSKCIDCNNCFLCKDCKNCQYCYGCYNLNNKSYFINNLEFSKEDYFKEISKYKDNFYEKRILINSAGINCNFFNINIENCIGDYILNSKNCYYCFGLMNSEKGVFSNRKPSIPTFLPRRERSRTRFQFPTQVRGIKGELQLVFLGTSFSKSGKNNYCRDI